MYTKYVITNKAEYTVFIKKLSEKNPELLKKALTLFIKSFMLSSFD